MAAPERSETSSYCPFKGDASYYSIPTGGGRSVDAIWTYEAVAAIKDNLAFYSDREGEDRIDLGPPSQLDFPARDVCNRQVKLHANAFRSSEDPPIHRRHAILLLYEYGSRRPFTITLTRCRPLTS